MHAPLEEGGDRVEHSGLHLQQGRREGGQVFYHRYLEGREGGRRPRGESKVMASTRIKSQGHPASSSSLPPSLPPYLCPPLQGVVQLARLTETMGPR